MKTISTKVDSQVYQQLVESCGKSGCSVSEKVRKLIEDSIGKPINNSGTSSENSPDAEKHESHYDRFGNYWTYNTERNVWSVRLNPENVRIKY